MESDVAAISCLIVLGIMLTCACSYLCTEGYSFITRIGRHHRRLTRPRLVRRDTTLSTQSEVAASICTPSTPSTSMVQSSIAHTQNLRTTTVLTEREIVRTETQQCQQQQLSCPPEVPPPPLPPRTSSILSPWGLVQTHTSRGRSNTQMFTLRDRLDRPNPDDFQYPPGPPRPVSLAAHFRNHVPLSSTSTESPNVHFIRDFNLVPIQRSNSSSGQSAGMPPYRQTIATLADLGLGGHAIWFPEHTPYDPEIDLPPTYEEAMEMRLQMPLQHSSSSAISANRPNHDNALNQCSAGAGAGCNSSSGMLRKGKKKNKKYIFTRRHSSNDDELPILHAQNLYGTPPERVHAHAHANAQSVRRSVTIAEDDDAEVFLGIASQPEHLSRSSPALLSALRTGTTETARGTHPHQEWDDTVPPPIPPRRPPPRSTRTLPRANPNDQQTSARMRLSLFTPSSSGQSLLSPDTSEQNMLRSTMVRNFDGLMSIVDYGSSSRELRRTENSEPILFPTTWRTMLNSRTFQAMSQSQSQSQFEDPPPSYEEAVRAHENEKGNEDNHDHNEEGEGGLS